MTARNEDRLIEVRRLLGEGHGVSEIARKLGITPQRASQLVHKAGYHFVRRLETKPKKDSSNR